MTGGGGGSLGAFAGYGGGGDGDGGGGEGGGGGGGGIVDSQPSRYARAYLNTPGWVSLVLLRYLSSPSLDSLPPVPVP